MAEPGRPWTRTCGADFRRASKAASAEGHEKFLKETGPGAKGALVFMVDDVSEDIFFDDLCATSCPVAKRKRMLQGVLRFNFCGFP